MAAFARRGLVGRALAALTGGLAFVALRATAREPSPPIEQPASPDPVAFMSRAAAMRRAAVAAGDQSYGAVVVRNGRIVGLGPSRVIQENDPTAHAEMTAIRDAARRLGSRDLSGATLYATATPCAMCETAAYFAGVAEIVVGDTLDRRGAPRYGGR